MNRALLLCCIPGGQAEALALARDAVDQDYVVVALFHLVRVVFVFVSMPLLLAVLGERLCGKRPQTSPSRKCPAFLILIIRKLQLFLLLRLGVSICPLVPCSYAASVGTNGSVLTFSYHWLGGVATGSRICSSCPACDWRWCRR